MSKTSPRKANVERKPHSGASRGKPPADRSPAAQREAGGDAACPPDPQQQRASFEEAVALFRGGDFLAAMEIFARAARGPLSDVSHSAAMYTNMCRRRMAGNRPELRTPEELYDYAVTLMNQADWAGAESLLRQALSAGGDAGHLHYATALCCGQLGNLEEARLHLARAIELDPRNRAAARADADLRAAANHPPIRELLYPGRSASG